MSESPLPRDLWWRPLRVWLFLAWFAVWGLRPDGEFIWTSTEMGVCLVCGAILVGLGAQSALFLGLARRGRITLVPESRTYRLWKFAPGAASWGLLGGLPGIGVGLLVASWGWPQLGLFAGATLVVLGGFWMLSRKLLRDLHQSWTPREDSHAAWLIWDTALPAGLLAAALAAGIAWLRLGHLEWVSGPTLARHLGGTLLLYSFLLGPTGAIKVGRERLSGVVKAPDIERNWPGPIVAGGVCSLLMLVLGPRWLPQLALANAIMVKITFSAVFGSSLAYLGALRGAQAHRLRGRRA